MRLRYFAVLGALTLAIACAHTPPQAPVPQPTTPPAPEARCNPRSGPRLPDSTGVPIPDPVQADWYKRVVLPMQRLEHFPGIQRVSFEVARNRHAQEFQDTLEEYAFDGGRLSAIVPGATRERIVTALFLESNRFLPDGGPQIGMSARRLFCLFGPPAEIPNDGELIYNMGLETEELVYFALKEGRVLSVTYLPYVD